ncbi:MAG: ribokinase [Chloroflexi bacterium]|nr:ribokinase [Chloroflexota bacterium]
MPVQAAAADLKRLVGRLAGRRVLVAGDVILDEYLIGATTRLSREAPVPVLEFEARRLIAGGAANPAANIAVLGGVALQVGVVGADAEADALRATLSERGIETGGLFVDQARPTTVKTRIMAQMGLRFPQQVARLDKISRAPLDAALTQQIVEFAAAQITTMDAVLLSDYQSGFLTPPLVAQICALAAAAGVLCTADAQGQFDKYSGLGIVKCNADEARAYLNRDLRTDDDFAQAAVDLRARLALTVGMVITRGADGATFATAAGEAGRSPAPAITDVFDTVGAGDTAIAVITLALAAGAHLSQAALLANYASGVVVRRVGNYAPTPAEVIAALDGSLR